MFGVKRAYVRRAPIGARLSARTPRLGLRVRAGPDPRPGAPGRVRMRELPVSPVSRRAFTVSDAEFFAGTVVHGMLAAIGVI